MGTAIANFNAGMPALPEDLAAFFDENENIRPKSSVPSLSYEGKTWSISLEGEKTKLMGKNAEGDEVPLAIMRVVVLAYADRRGRAYYEGAYDPTKISLPKCWSTDGLVPDDVVQDKQSSECKNCPWAAKGSKVNDAGNETSACSQHRMLVVLPTSKLDFKALRLKIAITSDYDGRSPDHEAAGWYSFSKYMEMLRANGVAHSARVSTKMKFDPNVAYPKLLFSRDNWLAEDQLRKIVPRLKSEEVTSLLDKTYTPNGADGVATSEAKGMPQGVQMPRQNAPAKPTQAAKPATKPAQVKQPEPVAAEVEEEEIVLDDAAFGGATGEVVEEEVVEETVAATPAKPAATKKATTKPAATKPQAAASQPSTNVPDSVGDLLADWD